MGRKDTGPVNQEVMVALAKAFRLTRPKEQHVSHPAYAQWLRDIACVAGVCKSFNSAFLRERFFRDCGYEEEEMKGEKS